MQKYLRQLKPDKFEDLIAMNALYRPGPMEYIPAFVNRKHGREPITYDLNGMEDFLAETYGITVYQQQVSSCRRSSPALARGDSDVLRKAMGKKQKAVLDKMKDNSSRDAANAARCQSLRKGMDRLGSICPVRLQQIALYLLLAGSVHTAYLKAN